MTDDEFTRFMQARNDALDAAIDALAPFFDALQIVAEATAPAAYKADAPRTLGFRRGLGSHNARIQLCRQQIERDYQERDAKTLLALSKQERP